MAQSQYIGPSGGDWDTLANWTAPGPVIAGTVWIDSGTVFATTSTGGTYVTVARMGTTAGLTITPTGDFLSQDSTIAEYAGSIGTVLVDGGRWLQPGWRKIGGAGTGEITVSNGGSITNTTAWLGFDSGGYGEALITGVGSEWINSERLVVGYMGQGMLNIEEGGSVVSDGGSIADFSGSSGEVTVSGQNSEWIVTDPLYVGKAGTGTLNIQAGGRVESDSAVIGDGLASSGEALVRGEGSSWTMGGMLGIGRFGSGTLTIANGARVASDTTYLGWASGVSGTVTVTGAGSEWSPGSWLDIGLFGTGSVVVADGAKVDAYSAIVGNGTGSSGTLLISGPGSQWSGNDLSVGGAGTGTLLIDNGARLNTVFGLVASSGGPGTATLRGAESVWESGQVSVGYRGVGVLNLGSAEGEAAAEAGRLITPAIQLGGAGGSATLVFNHTGSAYTVAAPIMGEGTIKQIAGTTILAGWAHSDQFSGQTLVSGGALRVNGNLGGDVIVSGGSLGGTGTIDGPVDVLSRTTLAPGNSVGSLIVRGDVGFASGSTLAIELDGNGNTDRLLVVGEVTADPGATVAVSAGPGRYTPGTRHSLVYASGGITGTFDVVSDFYFLTPTLDVVGSELELVLARNTIDIASIATNAGQGAVAGALDELGAGYEVYDSFMALDAAGARDLLDELSGKQHAGGQQMIANTFALFGNAMGQRRGGAGQGGTADAGAALGYVSAPIATAASAAIAAAASTPVSSRTAWLAPVAGIGRIENATGATDWLAGGLTLGADYATTLGDADVMAGLALGYIRSATDSPSAQSDANSGQIGAYGSWQEEALRLSGSLAYGLAYTETDRNLTVGGVDLVATSGAWSQTLGSSLELAYALPMGQGVTMSPLLGMDSSVSHRGATSETGAGAFALDISASTWAQLTPVLGFEIAHEAITAAGALNSYGRIAWQHDLLDAPDQQMRFTGTSSAFTLAGADNARDSLGLGLGSSLTLDGGLTLSADYAGTIASDRQSHGLRLSAGSSF